ncbi:MAG: twin-arginine translocase subunit TatC [Planctomycetota bacterium]|jgi:sec-independent protein translocase protein TatC
MKGDDLFEKSSMTFGEHLEELRRALAKASIWLGIGLLVGFPLASSVIKYMQGPLEASLQNFYRKQSEVEIAKALEVGAVSNDLSSWMKDNKVSSQVVWVDPKRLQRADSEALDVLKNADSEGLPNPNSMMRLRLFVPIVASTEALGLQEPFMIWLKAAFVVAVVVASPGIFFHLWQFIAAGLYPHERRYVYFFLPVSLLLFWAGAFLAFFVIFRLVIDFLLEFNASMGIGASPRLTDYMSFALFLPLGFGISFQLPLVMLILERLGIFSVATYLSQWRVAILVIAVISMVLTPADVSSMIGMAVPLVALYFLGIAMCHYLPRSNMQQTLRSGQRAR